MVVVQFKEKNSNINAQIALIACFFFNLIKWHKPLWEHFKYGQFNEILPKGIHGKLNNTVRILKYDM